MLKIQECGLPLATSATPDMEWVPSESGMERVNTTFFMARWISMATEADAVGYCTMTEDGDIFVLSDGSDEDAPLSPKWVLAPSEPDMVLVPKEIPPGHVEIITNGTRRIIPEGEPVFLLRGRDPFAGRLVRLWADFAKNGGVRAEQVEIARAHADKMDAWPTKQLPGSTKLAEEG